MPLPRPGTFASDIDGKSISVWSSEGHLETVQQAWGPQDTREKVQAFRYNGQLSPDAGFVQSGSGLAGGSWSTPDGPLNQCTTTDGRAGCSAHTFGAAAAGSAITSDIRRCESVAAA